MNLTRRLFALVLIAALLLSAFPVGTASAASQAAIVTPGLCRIKTDMQIPWLYSLPVNYHSRTRLPVFAKIPGGITPATIRLQGGVGNVQLSPAWMDYVDRINGRNPIIMKYLFHRDSGWQNSDQRGRVEEVAFENQWVNVLRISGNRAYLQTFHSNETQPFSSTVNDPRIQLFTIVTSDDKIIGTPKGPAYIILMARPGEQLYIGTQYLDCPSRLPKSVTVTAWTGLNLRAAPAITGTRIGSLAYGMVTIIRETQIDAQGNVWGRTDAGWIALRYNGFWHTDWQV